MKSDLLPKALRFFLLVWTAFPLSLLRGQEQNVSSRFLTVKDGLPQGFVSGIVQDKDGFVWISTRNGLARYDGKKFKVFYHNSNDTTSIAGNIIRAIFLDSRNRLWINYESAGFDVFYPETEKIYHVSKQPGFEMLENLETEIGGLFEDVNHNLLINSLHRGIIKLNIDKGPSLQYPLKNIIPDDEKIFGVTQNNKQNLFILTEKSFYHVNENYSLVKKTSFSVPSSIHRTYENRYGMFFPTDSTFFLSGTNALVKYQVKNFNFAKASVTPIIKFLSGRHNNYSIAYPDSKSATFTFSDNSRSYTFNTISIHNITSLVDKNNLLWIGTSGYGIQLVHLQPNSFQYFKYKPPFTKFLIEKYLIADPREIPKSLRQEDYIYNLRWTYDKKGKLWMCNIDSTDMLGMPVYRYDSSRFSRPQWHSSDGQKLNVITYGIGADSKNNLWVLGKEFRLYRLDQHSAAVETFSPLLPMKTTHGEESLLIDKQDNLWIASDYGLLQYREGWKRYGHYSIGKNISDEEANRVINIVEDLNDENNLWMGSIGNGLICFNKKEKKFIGYTRKDGLPDNTIYSVMADDKGYLWCSTNHGIFRFDTRTKKARKYTSENESDDFEFNRFHHLRLPDGRFAFAGFNDHTVFDPLSLRDDTSHPNVAIVSWKINNRPADYRDVSSPLQQSINSLKEVHLTHLQNFLTFEFAALQYNQPEIFEYRYKLSGVDKDWVYAGNNNSVNYTALPPGSYTLFVNATNGAGLWSPKVKELKIIIHPPWWKTWWAYLVYAAIAGSVIYVIARNRLKQVRLQHQMILNQKEAEQMKQLDELKSRFFSNITHELRTPLTLIISPLEKQLHENVETASRKLLKSIHQNARHLLKLINQLLDMSKLEGRRMQLSLSRGELVPLIEQLSDTFKPNAAEKQIQLSLDAGGIKGEYVFDSDKLEKVLNNLLSNALKFTPVGGSIFVGLSAVENNNEQHSIEITVKDTGIGISAKNLPNIFDRFFQADNSSIRKYEGTGIGLSLVQELVKLMNGSIRAESEEGKGSAFIVTLPMSPGHLRPDIHRLASTDIISDANEAEISFFPSESSPVSSPSSAEKPGDSLATAPLILVTDDNSELRDFITESLQSQYRVITAADGKDGWQQAQKELPDIIISDVMMPMMDGYEFCEKVKLSSATSHIAFVMLTAKTAWESKMSGLRMGADEYLSKPFHVEELLLRISNVLNRQDTLRKFYSSQLQPGSAAPIINEVEDAFLQKVYQVIEMNLDNENLDVEMLAGEVAVSRRTLNRKLAVVAGMPANEIIRNYRLKKAAELLLQGFNVADAAYRTGFSTPSWFTQCFKEMYGETPVVYTQKHRMSQN